MIEADHAQRQARPDLLLERLDQRAKRGHLRVKAQRPRRAGIQHQQHAIQRIGLLLLVCGQRCDARDRQVLMTQTDGGSLRLRHRHGDFKVDIGLKVGLLHGHRLMRQRDPTQRRAALARALGDGGPDVQALQLRQSAQVDAVWLVGARPLCRVRDDQLFFPRRRNWKHAGAELIACLFFQERRVLATVQEVFVGLARGLQLDHFAFLPAVANAHRKARDGSARRQRNLKLAL